MRTKSSSTARELECHSEVLRPLPHPCAAGPVWDHAAASADRVAALPNRRKARCGSPPPETAPPAASSSCGLAQGEEGLLHDARNLIGAIGLYCDLLSMPHVLRPEHRHYADELRLLGERGAALMEQLIERRREAAGLGAVPCRPLSLIPGTSSETPSSAGQPSHAEGLRPVVERCAGLLRRIAGEHALEFAYGEAAALPVCVPPESIERMLINLVRNASAAMTGRPGGIRIRVGQLPGEAGAMRPWPFQRVSLAVEDRGCGMTRKQMEELLAEAPISVPCLASGHGIGFRVVRELAQASGGELAIQSAPEEGTCVEIAWPVAQLEQAEHHATALDFAPSGGGAHDQSGAASQGGIRIRFQRTHRRFPPASRLGLRHPTPAQRPAAAAPSRRR